MLPLARSLVVAFARPRTDDADADAAAGERAEGEEKRAIDRAAMRAIERALATGGTLNGRTNILREKATTRAVRVDGETAAEARSEMFLRLCALDGSDARARAVEAAVEALARTSTEAEATRRLLFALGEPRRREEGGGGEGWVGEG